MKTASGLVTYAIAMIGCPYWYGTYGKIATSALYEAKKKQYPAQYTAKDFSTQYGKRVFDCVGLIKGYLWSADILSSPVYNEKQDVSARGMYEHSSVRGTNKSVKLKDGLLLYKGNSAATIHHVGIYHDGYVIEAKGHAYGVVKTPYVKTDWGFWSECPFLSYDEYYPAYTGTTFSIVDALYSVGEKDTSLAHRKELGILNCIGGIGTAAGNAAMLKLLKAGGLRKK